MMWSSVTYAIDLVVKHLIEKKQEHTNGHLCRKALDKAIEALAKHDVKMNRNTLCKRISTQQLNFVGNCQCRLSFLDNMHKETRAQVPILFDTT